MWPPVDASRNSTARASFSIVSAWASSTAWMRACSSRAIVAASRPMISTQGT